MEDNTNLKEEAVFDDKIWISITGLCNNNCLFCLDGDRKDKYHKSISEIKDKIKVGKELRNNKLILSGGEPTIHPNILEFVKYGKELGYGKIQVISNGRMFSSEKFTKEIFDSGLNEVTFSLHGHNKELHDSLTKVKGSFSQIIKGIINAKKIPGSIVNADININGLNYPYLLNTVKLLHKLGIDEINLMSLVPFGNAYKNKEEMFYDVSSVMPYVKEVIEYCKKNRILLWFSRFPEEFLDGNEEYIESTHKLIDELAGAEEIFSGSYAPLCKGDRCQYCGVKSICPTIEEINKKFFMEETRLNRNPNSDDKNTIYITRDDYKTLKEQSIGKKHVNYIFLKPPERIGNSRNSLPTFSEILPYLREALLFQEKENKDWTYTLRGIPFCITYDLNTIEKDYPLLKDYVKEEKLDYVEIAKDISSEAKAKSVKCKDCIFDSKCKGVFRNYVRAYGFSEIEPVKSKELRINSECNQKCSFCNTDSGAENTITDKLEVEEKIKLWYLEGIRYIIISGKEPTLDENLLGYIKLCKELGYRKIELQTNGIMCSDKKYVKSLKSAGLDSVFVSLHSLDEETSSKITNTHETFEKTIKGIKELEKLGISVTINFVINSHNYKQLPSFPEFVKERFDAKGGIVFSYVAPLNDALKNPKIIPKLSDVVPLLSKAIKKCEELRANVRIPSRCGIPICQMPKYQEKFDEYQEKGRWEDNGGKEYAEKCEYCGYKEGCSGIWSKYLERYGPDEFKLKFLDLNLGPVCNNECIFCVSDTPGKEFISKTDIKEDIDKYSSYGYDLLNLLGGEPTLHPDILEIVKYAKQKGFSNIRLVSNGRKYSDEEFLINLIKSGANHFTMSIHSHDEGVHNKLNSRKSFDEMIMGLRNLKKLRKSGYIKTPITSYTVINSLNYKSLPDTVNFLKKEGVENARLGFIRPTGRANTNFSTIVPRYKDIKEVIRRIAGSKPGIEITFDAIPTCISGIKNGESGKKLEHHSKKVDNLRGMGEYEREFFDWGKLEKKLKAKGENCTKCNEYEDCEGIWKEYAEKYGFSEFIPITSSKTKKGKEK